MTEEISEHAPWLSTVSPNELRRIIEALYRVHRLVAAMTDLNTLLERIIEESRTVARAEASSLMLYDHVSDELYFEVALGEQGDQQALKREIRLAPGQGIAGAAAQSRESINVPDVTRDPQWDAAADVKSKFQTRNLLAVPLLDKDKLIGVIEVLNKIDGEAFTDTDKHVMEMFSALAATVIANARLIENNLKAERLAAIGEAVASVSHYTKNIIAGMSASVDLIDERLTHDDLDGVHHVWPIFRRNADRVSGVVEDMLTYTKARIPIRERCDINTFVDDCVKTLRDVMARKHIQIEMDLAQVSEDPEIDVRSLFRCVLNLLENAIDAAPAQGGRIGISAFTAPGGDFHLMVTDNGTGIPAGKARLIFEPFYSTKGSSGTGLGLAVAQKVVREHGGEITAQNTPDGGAQFRLVIPRRQNQE